MTRIAFFDLDRTVIARNSASLWIRAEMKAGYITPWQALRAVGWLGRYALGATDVRPALRESIASLRGKPERDLRERSFAFFREQVLPLVRPGAHRAISEHRDRGDRLVLLTSSTPYLSAPVTDALGLDDYLCTELEIDPDGNFTGEPVEPLCFGEGKVERAHAYAQQRGATLEESVFYSDSRSDLPMLEAVGRPVVINPDPRLRREAERRGWPVDDWGMP